MSDLDKMLENIEVARKAIIEDSKGEKSVSGRLDPCPVCSKGVLAYAVAYNGHVHAKCEAGCVQWME